MNMRSFFPLPYPEGQSGGDAASPSVGGGGSGGAAPGSTSTGGDASGSSAPSAPSSVPSSDPGPQSQSPLPPEGGADDGTPSDVFDFNGLLSGQFEDGDIVAPPVAAPTVIPPVPATPGAPPAATPIAPVVAAVAPVAAAAPAAATGQQAPLSLAEPGRLAEAMASQEAAIVEEAARTMFALSPEEITGLEENAVAVIPKLLARTYFQAQRSMLTTLQRALPAMLGNHLTQKQKHDTNENTFYDKWKDSGIDRAQHGALVTRLAAMYRQMNPKATFDQMVSDLGPMVVMAAKIQPPAPAPQPRGGNGFARPQVQPFVPAGGGPGAMSSQSQGDPWDVLDPNRPE